MAGLMDMGLSKDDVKRPERSGRRPPSAAMRRGMDDLPGAPSTSTNTTRP
jgi:hypothetical protein